MSCNRLDHSPYFTKKAYFTPLMEDRIYNESFWIGETDPRLMREFFDQALRESGFTILNFTDHHFEPEGYTALWLLGESHLALHSFPESARTYVEITSCNLGKYLQFRRMAESRFILLPNSPSHIPEP